MNRQRFAPDVFFAYICRCKDIRRKKALAYMKLGGRYQY